MLDIFRVEDASSLHFFYRKDCYFIYKGSPGVGNDFLNTLFNDNTLPSLPAFPSFEDLPPMPPMNEILRNALSEAGLSVPPELLNQNLEHLADFPLGDYGLEHMDSLRSEIESAGGLDSYISTAMADSSQPISRVAAAMALRDTAKHMGMSLEQAMAMLSLNPQGLSETAPAATLAIEDAPKDVQSEESSSGALVEAAMKPEFQQGCIIGACF